MAITLEEAVQAIQQKQAVMEVEIVNISERLAEQTKLTESVHALAMTTRDLAHEQKTLSTAVVGIRTDVDMLKEKPGKRWELAVTLIISVVVTSVLTFILTKAGLN